MLGSGTVDINIMIKHENFDPTTPVLFSLTFLFLIFHYPIIDNDSPGYIQGELIRQPLDHLFISLFYWAKHYQLFYVMWAQSILTIFALCYARNWLKKKLKVSDFLILPVLLIVLISICFYYQMTHIDSEGIAFPIFIFTFFNLLDCFFEKNYFKIIISSILVGALILTRTQFYFFYGVFFVLISWFILNKLPVKYIFTNLAIFIFSAILTNFLDHTYHYYKNGYFVTEPFSGILTVIQPLYLSESNSADYFNNPFEKKQVQFLLDTLKKENLNHEKKNLNLMDMKNYQYSYQEYSKNYNTILQLVCSSYSNSPCQSTLTISPATLLSMNTSTSHITKILFLHNIRENSLLFIYKIINSIGNISFFGFIFYLLFSVFFSLIKNTKRSNEIEKIFIMLSLIIIISNAGIIAVAEPSLPEYTCYSQFLLYCLAAFFAKKVFFN